jgi:hypothetical protein
MKCETTWKPGYIEMTRNALMMKSNKCITDPQEKAKQVIPTFSRLTEASRLSTVYP